MTLMEDSEGAREALGEGTHRIGCVVNKRDNEVVHILMFRGTGTYIFYRW